MPEVITRKPWSAGLPMAYLSHYMNEQTETMSRIEQLETKVAHLEHALQQLSDALYAQQRELDRVADRNRQLLDELDGGAAATSATAIEKPPHY
jgi:SlyX protein